MTQFTDLGFPYPESTDNVQLWTKFQDLADGIDAFLNLPAEAEAHSANPFTITSTTFAALPGTPLTLAFTNPSSVYDLLVDVSYSAWCQASASDVRGGLAATGGMTFTPTGFGAGGAVANSDNLFCASPTTVGQKVTIPVVIPAGAAAVTFALQAMRSVASGTQAFNYPTLRVSPRRFLV